MSSINSYFTFQYSQPEEYKFSHDSVFLARHVFNFIQSMPLNKTAVMDLCAGCGVVGLDLLFHLKQVHNTPAQIDFIEVQKIYREHFDKNKEQVPCSTTINFIEANYKDLIKEQNKNKYDIIISNPPYFLPHQGKLSPSEFKNRCRFFLDASFVELMNTIAYTLKTDGTAYLLVRSLKDHNIDLTQAIPASLCVVDTHSIRGTDVLHIKLASSAS